MTIRRWLAAAVCVAFTLSNARAADMAGEWALDTEHFRAQMEEMMSAQMGDVPEAMKPQMRQMMDGILAQLEARMGGTMVFDDDGTAVLTRPDGETAEARWEDQGDTILLIPEGEDAQTMEGRVEGDALTFELESPETDMVMEMIWRRR